MKVLLDPMAHLIDLHVAAFVCNLRRHDNDLALCDPLLHLLIKGVQQRLRDPSDAEALDDQAIIVLKQVFHQLGLGPGDQLQHHDTLAQMIAEADRFGIGLLRKKADDLPVLYHRQHREVDAAEGVVAAGIGFLRAGPRNDIPVENKRHAPGSRIPRIADAVDQVLPRVGALFADRLLGSGHDDRLIGVLDHVRQCRAGIGHGVRTVADDKAVVVQVFALHRRHDLVPDRRGHIGAVDVADLDGVQIVFFTQFRDVGQHLFRSQARPQAVLGRLGGNRPARGDQQDSSLFTHALSPSAYALTLCFLSDGNYSTAPPFSEDAFRCKSEGNIVFPLNINASHMVFGTIRK